MPRKVKKWEPPEMVYHVTKDGKVKQKVDAGGEGGTGSGNE